MAIISLTRPNGDGIGKTGRNLGENEEILKISPHMLAYVGYLLYLCGRLITRKCLFAKEEVV